MNCPKCSGMNTQKTQLAYKSGTSDIDTTTVGIGVGSGIGIGAGSTFGKQKTKLAEELAPPEYPNFGDLFGLLMTLAGWRYVFIFLFRPLEWESNVIPWFGHVILIFSFIFGTIIGWFRIKYFFGGKHAKEVENWESEWFCHSCGYRWNKK